MLFAQRRSHRGSQVAKEGGRIKENPHRRRPKPQSFGNLVQVLTKPRGTVHILFLLTRAEGELRRGTSKKEKANTHRKPNKD